jgi:hypothetical protein
VVSHFSRVFDAGVDVEGTDLGHLRDDVCALQSYWVTEINSSKLIVHRIAGRDFSVPLVVDLYSRAEQLLQAVRIAERCSAFISFS